jgi:hypothetical protein
MLRRSYALPTPTARASLGLRGAPRGGQKAATAATPDHLLRFCGQLYT